jgi:predicted transcriptional regulator
MNANDDPTKMMTVRLPRELVEQIRLIARAHDRSLSGQLRFALSDHARRLLPEAQKKLSDG